MHMHIVITILKKQGPPPQGQTSTSVLESYLDSRVIPLRARSLVVLLREAFPGCHVAPGVLLALFGRGSCHDLGTVSSISLLTRGMGLLLSAKLE